MIIRPLDCASDLWNRALRELPGAVLYNGSEWLALLRAAYGFEFEVAFLQSGRSIAAACVFARLHKLFARPHLAALPFSDSCPPLAADSQAMSALLHQLESSDHRDPSVEIRGLEAPEPWRTDRSFQLWSIDLTRPLAVLNCGLDRDFRRKVRRGREAAIRIERGANRTFVERFYRLQLETRRHYGLPPQPLRFFTATQEIYSRGQRFDVWIAADRNGDLAGSIHLRLGQVVYRKWAARRLSAPSYASHLLLWTEVEALAGRAERFDLGRTDTRNRGSIRFKHESGATKLPLPYSYYPGPPRNVSPEILQGPRKMIASVLRHAPLPLMRFIGNALYSHLG